MNVNEFLSQKLYGKKIVVICTNDESYTGIYDSHISELDNEPDGESILIIIPNFGLTEIPVDEIKRIELASLKDEFRASYMAAKNAPEFKR